MPQIANMRANLSAASRHYTPHNTRPCACRSNLSYQRYNEGRTALQTFTSKLTDVMTQATVFDVQTVVKDPSEKTMAGHQRFKNTMTHLVSLMHAVALQTLRDDYDMENIMVRAY